VFEACRNGFDSTFSGLHRRKEAVPGTRRVLLQKGVDLARGGDSLCFGTKKRTHYLRWGRPRLDKIAGGALKRIVVKTIGGDLESGASVLLRGAVTVQ